MSIEQTQSLPPPGEASPVAEVKQDAKADMKGHTADPTVLEPTADDQAAETPTDQSEGEDKPKKKGGGFQNRIDRLTRRAAEAEREAAELRQQLTQSKPAAITPTDADPEPQRPKETDFSDWTKFEEAKEDYIVAKAEWKARQAIASRVQEAQSRQQTEQVQNQRREAVKRFEKAAEAVAPHYEGLDEAVDRFFSDKSMPVSQAMAEYIMEHSERGPELVYALDADLDEAERISKLPPIAAAKALARLEDKLPKPEARKVSGAPAPTKTVKGSAESPVKRPEDMSMAEYKAWANNRDKKAGTLKQNVTR